MSDTGEKSHSTYCGFEQGPIRPPSEAASLLIRVTRNCPWNRCTFCPVYSSEKFSLRPVDHVLHDIDTIHKYISLLRNDGGLSRENLSDLAGSLDAGEKMALAAAINWMRHDMRSIFLQDANSLIIKPDDLITILNHLKHCFPWVERITSYARSHTICRIKENTLKEMRVAGLNRIHIGMESGSDKVLQLVRKGSTKQDHIDAGIKVKNCNIELSEYIMPGLGGRDLSREHALETADALNRINADFIRLRSLAVPNHVELHNQVQDGSFHKLTDREVAAEILLFLNTLGDITSTIKSDHILNLFEEVAGDLPQDKKKMTAVIEDFLHLPAHDQMLYQVGRRTGVFSRLSDLQDPGRRAMAESSCQRFHITPENVDGAVEELMKRFI